jgi:hypothetical protein
MPVGGSGAVAGTGGAETFVPCEVPRDDCDRNAHCEHSRGYDHCVQALPGLKRRVLLSTAGETGKTPDGIEILSLEKLVEELERGTFFP